MSYQRVEADVISESRSGSVSTMRVLREMAANAAIHTAPKFSELLNDACDQFNRSSHRATRHGNALKAILYALHARPFFGGPHLSLEDAIAAANALLDSERPGANANDSTN